MQQLRLVFAVTISFLTSCTYPMAHQSKPPSASRGPHASEHRELANYHFDAANQQRVIMDRRSNGLDNGMPSPWYRSWGSNEDHEQLAQFHRAQASELQAVYDAACADLKNVNPAVSPLTRLATGGWATQGGAIVYLAADSGSPAQVMQEIACHRAWMMLAPANMQDCPLDLRGLQIDIRGDGNGVTLALSVQDLTLVPELQRRVALEMR